jgi:replicative superfamily II helicase
MLGTRGGAALPPNVEPLRIVQPSEHSALCNDLVNAVVALAYETASASYGALVFCNSRKGCENDATIISQAMPDDSELSNDIRDRRRDVIGNLRNTSVGLDSTLGKTITKGVAFHRKFFLIQDTAGFCVP